MKRSAFRIECPCAGRAARGTISWPTSVASQTLPPVRVPWPYGITLPLVSESKFDFTSHVLARSLLVQLKHAQTSLRPHGGDSGAHWAQGRAPLNQNLFPHSRAHAQIQTDMQTELYDQKPSGLNIKFFSDGIFVSRETGRTAPLTTGRR